MESRELIIKKVEDTISKISQQYNYEYKVEKFSYDKSDESPDNIIGFHMFDNGTRSCIINITFTDSFSAGNSVYTNRENPQVIGSKHDVLYDLNPIKIAISDNNGRAFLWLYSNFNIDEQIGNDQVIMSVNECEENDNNLYKALSVYLRK